MTIKEILGEIPMGLGSYVMVLLSSRSPEIAERVARRLDKPIRAFEITFGDGDALVIMASELEGDNASASDNGSGPQGDCGPLPGPLSVAG